MTSPLFNTTGSTKLPLLGLSALSFSVFLSITSETMPMGLLPEMSSSLGVSESQIGLLVTIFAFTVVLTSTALIRVTRRLPRHGLMISILMLLAACNLLTATLPEYWMIVGARILGGIAHGMFWALTPAYASRLVPSHLIGRAITIALTGGTLAMVLGVPLGTALGHSMGWRFAFGAVSGALLLGAVAVYLWLPRVGHEAPAAPAVDGKPVARSANILPVALLCVVVALTMTGYYAFFTFIAPFLVNQIGVPSDLLSLALLVFGLCGAASLLFTGGIFSRLPIPGLLLGLSGCVVAVGVIAGFTQNPIIALVAMGVWGFAFGLVPPLAQTLMLRSSTPAQRDTAGAFYTTAFNIGIGGGALVGAILLAEVGLHALPLFSVGLTLIALVMFVIARPRIAAAVERNS